MSLRIRRGSDVQRSGIAFDLGEIIWTTDTKKLFVGDGTQAGGYNILSNSAGTGLQYDNTVAGGVLKLNDSYVTSMITSQFVHSDHSGISFAINNNVLVATVDISDANEAAIREIVTAIFDPETTTSTNPTVDLIYSYNQSSGKMITELSAERVKFYSESLLTSVDAVHTNISFTYDSENNVVNATVSDNTIKDVSSTILTDNTQHSRISFSYDVDTNKIAATVSGFLIADAPVLAGQLDLNSFDIVGNGDIKINGTLSLTEQASTPGIQPTGAIAIADGDSNTGWNPLESISGAPYPVYYNGTDWIHLSDYQNKNVYFVDPSRTDGHIPTGTIINPFYSVADALTAASNGLNELFPTYIILMSDIQEDVILTESNIFITGISSNAKNGLVKIIGSVAINANVDDSIFSIANIQIEASDPARPFIFSGTHSQTATLKNVKLTNINVLGQGVNDPILINNSGISSNLTFEDCTIIASAGSAINVTEGFAEFNRCYILNSQTNSNGFALSAIGSIRIIHSIMNIPTGSGKAIYGLSGSSAEYQGMIFDFETNRSVSTDVTLLSLESTFTQV